MLFFEVTFLFREVISKKSPQNSWSDGRYFNALCDLENYHRGQECDFGNFVAKTLRVCVCVWKAPLRLAYIGEPRERNSGEMFRRQGRKLWQKFGKQFVDLRPSISRKLASRNFTKILGKFHGPWHKFFHRETLGAWGHNSCRGPPTTHHPHKRPSSSGGIFEGWCSNCLNLRKRKNMHHPQFCTRDVDCRFVGVVRGFCGLILQHASNLVQSNWGLKQNLDFCFGTDLCTWGAPWTSLKQGWVVFHEVPAIETAAGLVEKRWESLEDRNCLPIPLKIGCHLTP